MADEKLDLLENRLEKMEMRIYGDADKDSAYPKESPAIVDTLASLKHQFNKTVARSKKAGIVVHSLGELNDFLDPSFTDPLTLSQQAKTDLILAEESFLRETAENLEKIQDLTGVLGSEVMKVTQTTETRVRELSKVHLQQQDGICEFSDDVKQLMSDYNTAITLLSKQFIQWDEIVTKLEVEKQTKKPLD